MSEPTEDEKKTVPTASKDGKPAEEEINPKKVVVTYQGEKKVKKEDLPAEIKPHSPSYVVGNPVDTGVNPVAAKTTTMTGSVIKSQLHPTIPKEILPKASFEGTTSPQTDMSSAYRTSTGPLTQQTSASGGGSIPPKSSAAAGAAFAPPPSAEPQAPTPGGGSSGLPTFLSLLALCGVAVLVFYTYYSQQQLLQLQSQTTNDKSAVSTLVAQAQQTLADISGIQAHNEKDRQALETLKTNLEKSQTRLLALTKDTNWVLSEVNYLVFMANERLQMAKDVPTAIVQLEQAESRLQDLGDPGLLKTKEILAKDIAKLRMHPQMDRQQVWEQIEALDNSLSQLPFKNMENTLPTSSWLLDKELPEDTPGWRKALWRSWLEIKSLIRVSREDKNPIAPLLSLQDKAQILHTMQLMCEQAQWAVLHGDGKIFTSSLKSLEEWVKQYLAPSNEQEQVIKQIQALMNQPVAVPDVEITETLQALSTALHGKHAEQKANPSQPGRMLE